MKRHSVEELKALLEGTTEGEWSEERIGAIFRGAPAHDRTAKVLLAGVRREDGSLHYGESRPNAVLMTIARNLAVDLLDMKTHRYGQEDCDGCAERDAEIERLKFGYEFDAARLRRLATLCGLPVGNESDEFILNTAGTILGSICRVVENLSSTVKVRELECSECKHIEFHEQCHEVQEKTAQRCMVLASSEPRAYDIFTDRTLTKDPQTRIALKIKSEFGVEEGPACPACRSTDTVLVYGAEGRQQDGQEAGVSVYRCIACKEQWSD